MNQHQRPVIRVSVIAILIFEVFALFTRSALDLAMVRRGIERSVASDLSYLVVPPLLALLLFPYLREHREVLSKLLSWHDLTFRLVSLSLLTGILLRITWWASLTSLMWLGIVKNSDPFAMQGPVFSFECPPVAVLALSMVVMSLLVPLVEEVVNRGLLLHALLPRGTALAILLSATFFTLMHQSSSGAIAFLGGILLAVQKLNFRTLWAPIITHGSYNAAATVQWECLQFIWNPDVTDPALIEVGRIAAPVAVFGIWICCWLVGSHRAAGTFLPRPLAST